MERQPEDREAVEVILTSINKQTKQAQGDIRTLKSTLAKTRKLIEQSKQRIARSDKLLAGLSQPPDGSNAIGKG